MAPFDTWIVEMDIGSKTDETTIVEGNLYRGVLELRSAERWSTVPPFKAECSDGPNGAARLGSAQLIGCREANLSSSSIDAR